MSYETDILSPAELERLAGVIGEIERGTSGELRLMIVARSSRAPHAALISGLWLATLGLVALWVWRYEVILHEHAFWFAAGTLSLAAGLGVLLARLPVVQRRLAPDLSVQVLNRAELEFHREGLGGTRGATGILIFLSRFERQAVVLADRAIAARLPPETWRDVIARVLEGGRTGSWYPKLEEAIRMCGAILAREFPVQPGDVNELPNHVIVKP